MDANTTKVIIDPKEQSLYRDIEFQILLLDDDGDDSSDIGEPFTSFRHINAHEAAKKRLKQYRQQNPRNSYGLVMRTRICVEQPLEKFNTPRISK